MPKFPAIAADGTGRIRQYPIDAAATYKLGAAVLLDGDEELTEAGANPALILGFAESPVTSGKLPGELADSTTVIGGAPVSVAEEGRRFWISGDNDPVAGDVNQQFGITKDGDGIWHLDGTKTGATARLYVHDVDLERNLYLVSVLAANRQVAP